MEMHIMPVYVLAIRQKRKYIILDIDSEFSKLQNISNLSNNNVPRTIYGV